MRATAEPVEGSKVRLSIEVDESEVDRVLEEAVRKLSREVRVPGFRPGKVPRRVLEARMGGAVALRGEALRDALPDFYARAVIDAEVDPIAPPDIDITAGEEAGPVAFDAVVQVRPIVSVPGYSGLQVTLPSLAVSDEEVEAQVDRLREHDGELVEVKRPAIDKDNLTINLHGETGAGEEVIAVDDFVYEVGSGSVVPELDQELRGSKTGDVLVFKSVVRRAAPSGNEAPQEEASFRVLVKEVKEKRLPDLTDDWVKENSEFSTVEELREDIKSRISRVKLAQAQFALRENSLSALVELVDDEEVPEVLVDDEVKERIHDLGHRLGEQHISFEQFFAATGRTEEDLLSELRVDARRAAKVDLALRAVAEAEDLQVSDEELDQRIGVMAERVGVDSGELREQLDRNGRTGAVRSEERKTKALSWLLDNIEFVDEDGNSVSREDLRTDQGDEPDQGNEMEASVDVQEEAVQVATDEAEE